MNLTAMSPKPNKQIPLMIYLDNGPVAKSLVFQRVCKQLGIEIHTHKPAGSVCLSKEPTILITKVVTAVTISVIHSIL